MALSKVRLGDYIEKSTVNNKNLIYKEDLIMGVTSDGVFSKPKGNVSGVDLQPYKIVKNGAFVYNPSRFDIGSIAYYENDLCIVSHLYMVFYLNEIGRKRINPYWLYIYLRRKEFQREVRFRNFGSQRPEFNFNDISEIIIPLPDLPTQEKFVKVYLSMLENQKSYERGLEDLKLVCDGYIEDLRRKMPCKKIGPYISERREKNENGAISKALGISKEGFIDPKQDTGDLSNYWIFQRKDFVYSPPRINVGSIGLYDNDESCVCSPIYVVFYINDQQKILPEYLDMWLHRSEFLRSTDFYSLASVRNNFSFDLMSEVAIPIPSIGIQRSIVEIYSVYKTRKQINEDLKEQIKNICPILIKGSIEEAR